MSIVMNEKYTVSLNLMSELVYTSIGIEVWDDPAVVNGWAKLFDYIYANFDPPNKLNDGTDLSQLIDECVTVFDNDFPTIWKRLSLIPPDYTDYVFPFAIARYLLYSKGPVKLKISGRYDPEFSSRYADIIMPAFFKVHYG